ncbi:MAG: porin [Burkholderiales bacterium]
MKIKPRNRFGWGPDNGWGAWEVGLRYSFFDGSDFKTANPVSTGQLGAGAPTTTPAVTTSTNKATAYTAQIKWIHNTYVRALLDYVRTEFDTPVVANGQSVDHEDAIMMRVQVDF